MFVDEQRDDALAKVHRPTHFCGRGLAMVGARDVSSATNPRAEARFLFVRLLHPGLPGRCLTRAKSSLFAVTNHDSRVTYHFERGGTVNRPRTHVTHRKQTTGHTQGRNFPVHFLFRFSARFSRVFRASLSGVPETVRVLGWLSGVPETVRVLGRLPGTSPRI